MLHLNQQRTWVHWPEADIHFLLSPLGVTLRQRLVEQSTDYESSDKQKRRGRVNAERFNALVAEHCIHDWKGVVRAGGDGEEAVVPVACAAAAKAQLLELEPANIFIFTTVQGLDMHLVREAKAAGNG